VVREQLAENERSGEKEAESELRRLWREGKHERSDDQEHEWEEDDGHGGGAMRGGRRGRVVRKVRVRAYRRWGSKRSVRAHARSLNRASPPGYEYGRARYAKGMVAVQTKDSVGEYAGRAQRLLHALKARYTNREKAYILSPSKFARFEKLYVDGWDADLKFDSVYDTHYELTPPPGEKVAP
jgi:hypothetical protein